MSYSIKNSDIILHRTSDKSYFVKNKYDNWEIDIQYDSLYGHYISHDHGKQRHHELFNKPFTCISEVKKTFIHIKPSACNEAILDLVASLRFAKLPSVPRFVSEDLTILSFLRKHYTDLIKLGLIIDASMPTDFLFNSILVDIMPDFFFINKNFINSAIRNKLLYKNMKEKFTWFYTIYHLCEIEQISEKMDNNINFSFITDI